MGAWTLRAAATARLGRQRRSVVRYIGRPERASPAEGYADAHTGEQARIVEAALTVRDTVAEPCEQVRAGQ